MESSYICKGTQENVGREPSRCRRPLVTSRRGLRRDPPDNEFYYCTNPYCDRFRLVTDPTRQDSDDS